MEGAEFFEFATFASPAFSPDGRLSFLVRDGNESYVALQRDRSSPPRQLSDDSHRIVDYGWTGDESVWYLPEQRDALYHVHPTDSGNDGTSDHSRTEPLPEDNDGLFDVRYDGDTGKLAVFVRDNFSYAVELYEDDPSGSPTSRVFSDQYVSLGSWNGDATRLVAKTVEHSFSHDLVVYEVGADSNRTVTPADAEARYDSVHWGPDDEVLYLVTDYGADRLYAATLDPDARDPVPEPIVEDPEWNVQAIGVHPSGRALYVINRGGLSQLYVADVTDERLTNVRPVSNLPSGVATHAAFGDAGTRLAITVSTERIPSSVFCYDIETHSVRRWTAEEAVSTTPDTTTERISDVVTYEAADDEVIPALFSRPPAGSESDCAVVDVHGGPESQRRPRYRPRIRWLLDRGHAVVEPNIRGSIGYGRRYASLDDGRGRLDAVEDVARAAEWVRDRTGCDSVIVYGQSHGGLLALVTAYRYGERIDAAISEAGIYDLEEFIRSVEVEKRSLRTAEYGNPRELPDLYEELSPVRHADVIDVPTLLIHGTDDRQVRCELAPKLARLIRESGTHAKTLLLEDEGHQIGNVDDRLRTVQSFIDSVTD